MTAIPADVTRARRSTSAFRAHLVNEFRLLLREPAVVIFGALAPIAAIIVMTLFPAAREPVAELGGLSVIDTYTPILILFAASMLGLTVIPSVLGGYRAMGVLRRLRTTPSSPGSLLAALFVLVTGIVVVVSALIMVVPTFVGAPLPRNLGMYGLTVLLSILAFVALGVVVAALIPNGKAAGGLGNLIAMINWFLGGLWYPRALFPDWLGAIADFSPGGASVSAMTEASIGADVSLAPILVLLGWAVGGAVIAAAIFRWE